MMAMGFEADFGEMVAWQPTVQLRFVNRPSYRGGTKILQQLWTSSMGTREWRDVETQSEDK